jgi:hypothetical protein
MKLVTRREHEKKYLSFKLFLIYLSYVNESNYKIIFEKFNANGTFNDNYLLYSKNGWQFKTANDCKDSISHNPHTGQGKGTDGAAHCRCVCCIEFIKN